MIDNEFVTVKYTYQTRSSVTETDSQELGLHECGVKSHMNKYYSKE